MKSILLSSAKNDIGEAAKWYNEQPVIQHKLFETNFYKIDCQNELMVMINRIDNPQLIDKIFIQNELLDGRNVIIQFSDKYYTDSLLSNINEICSVFSENLEVRFYGHDFDCKTLEKIPEVKSLYVDCITSAKNINSLTKLSKLKELSIGVYELKETEILNAENFRNLKKLIIGPTKTKALNLSYMELYQDLKTLIVCGHTKGIDSIGQVPSLESLSLNSISKTPINFVNKLKGLKSLNFLLGGRENINEIEGNEIENLEIVWVRGFCDFPNISHFKKLKNLTIEDEIRLPNLSFTKQNSELRTVKILNCKTFHTLNGLENLVNLHELRISRTNIDFNAFIQQKCPMLLKILAFYTTKKILDEQIKNILSEKGYGEFTKIIPSNQCIS